MDRRVPLPPQAAVGESALRRAIQGGIGAIAIALALVWYSNWSSWMVAKEAFPDGWTGMTIVVFALWVAAAYFATVTVHEAAHTAAGIGLGFRIDTVRIGPLMFEAPHRLSFYRGRWLGAAGAVTMHPRVHDHLIVRDVLVSFAGAAANLVSAGIVLLVPGPTFTFGTFFVVISLVLGASSLVPFRTRTLISDGERIVLFLRNPERAQRWIALGALFAELTEGVPAENLSPFWLAKAVATQDATHETVIAYTLAYAAAYWQHDDARAAGCLETRLKYSSAAPAIQREAAMCDAAVFQARRRRHVELAVGWRDDIPARTELPWLGQHADAAIREAAGDPIGALRELDESEAVIRDYSHPPTREIALRFLKRWKDELRT